MYFCRGHFCAPPFRHSFKRGALPAAGPGSSQGKEESIQYGPIHEHLNRDRQPYLGHPAVRPDHRLRHLADAARAPAATAPSGARAEIHGAERIGRRGRSHQLRRPVYRPVRHHRHRQHRRRGHGHRRRRPRRPVLDGAGRLLRHGHEIFRGPAGHQVPHRGQKRPRPWRPLLLHRARHGQELEVAGQDLRLPGRHRRPAGHRHHHPGERHHLRRPELL